VYVADGSDSVRVLQPTNQSVLIGAVVDAASQGALPISPGKIVVIYGAGMGPAQLISRQPTNGAFSTQTSGLPYCSMEFPARFSMPPPRRSPRLRRIRFPARRRRSQSFSGLRRRVHARCF
jgi:hypothetical protein